jgi:hypothetical protein
MYLRAGWLFTAVGAEKSNNKMWYLVQLNRARDPSQRVDVHQELTGVLDEVRRYRTVSLLLDVTAALVALDRLMGRTDEADELLRSLDDRAALLEQVEWASGIMKPPLRSDRLAAFFKRQFAKSGHVGPSKANRTRKSTATRSKATPRPAQAELAPKTTKSTKSKSAMPSPGTPKPAQAKLEKPKTTSSTKSKSATPNPGRPKPAKPRRGRTS